MTNILRSILSLPIVIILALLIVFNYRLYFSPEMKIIGRDTINYDLAKELRGLQSALTKNADQDMQHLYPEGYLFMNALYGLAWCNAIKPIDHNSAYFNEGHQEIQKTIAKINSELGHGPFDKTLPLPFGAFYVGWSTYLLGKKISIESSENRDLKEVAYFNEQCRLIASSIKDQVYPASYPGGAWPADAMLCVASLSLHDKIFPAEYTDVIDDWLQRVKENLDSNGLIPHSITYQSGKPEESARGSSQSLMLIFLKEIDDVFAEQQFQIYKTKFIDTRFGLLGIREYTKSNDGQGDIDSGPVILQLGAAATIVGIQTLHIYGEYETSKKIRNAIEACGFPLNSGDQKFYLLGQLPIADAFIAWTHSTETFASKAELNFITFHLYSIGFGLLLLFFLWKLWSI